MSTRVAFLALGVGGVVLAMTIMGGILVREQQRLHETEIQNKAMALLEAIKVPCVFAMGSGEFERLDRAVGDIQERLGETADVLAVQVLDHNGRIVAHSDKERYGENPTDPFLKQAAASTGSILQYSGDGGDRVLHVGSPLESAVEGLPGIRWGTIVAELDMTRPDRQVAHLLHSGWIVVLICAICAAIIIVVVMQRTFVSPLRHLSRAAESFSKGELKARCLLTGKGEIPRLGRVFNSMAEHLEAHTRRLQDLVKERTERLDETNRQLTATMTDLKQANQQLEALVRTDPLTGLFNRRYMEEVLPFHVALAGRSGYPLSFAMLDVDYFKNYNDTNGHPAGDVVLRDFADLLQRRLRRTDIPCRYGGEEFAILLPNTPLTKAVVVAEHIRKLVEQTKFPNEESQPQGKLTVSVGVTSMSKASSDPMELVRIADQALYKAKAEGRNRTVLLSWDELDKPA